MMEHTHFDSMTYRQEPGPIDPSVLYDQAANMLEPEHRSEAIWRGEEPGVLKCTEHFEALDKWKIMEHRQLDMLAQSGFYTISRMYPQRLDRALITCLVERWRRETNTFHFRSGEMTITLQDVAILLGLRIDGSPVTGSTDMEWPMLCQEMLGATPPRFKDGMVSLKWLRTTFGAVTDDSTNLDVLQSTRAYILYILGCIIFPDTTGSQVHLKYLPLIFDIGRCRGYAWGAACLANLYRELGKATRVDKHEIAGCLMLLQCWSWEHLHIGRPKLLSRPDEDEGENQRRSEAPLACRWKVPHNIQHNPQRVLIFYRAELDTQLPFQIIWRPYKQDFLDVLPTSCLEGVELWLSRTPLIFFEIVEMHCPDRVMRQFGRIQRVPEDVEKIERFTRRGRNGTDWVLHHGHYILRWAARHQSIHEGEVDTDPPADIRDYIVWYRMITRHFISRPSYQDDMAFQPDIHVHRAAYDNIFKCYKYCTKNEGHEWADYLIPKLADAVNALSIYGDPPHSEHLHAAGQADQGSPHSSSPGCRLFDVLVAFDTGSSYDIPSTSRFSDTAPDDIYEPAPIIAPDTVSDIAPDTDEHQDYEVVNSNQDELGPTEVVSISWPPDGTLTMDWIQDLTTAFEWSSRNLPPSAFPTILPVHVLECLVLSASNIFHKEPNCVRIDGGDSSNIVVVGDVHGQLHDVIFLLKDAGFPSESQFFVFNGDYVDRGAWGLETFLLLLSWKVFLPHRVFLLRGNHESKYCTSVYGFEKEVKAKYGDQGRQVYRKCLRCFAGLPLASLIAGCVYTAHGGLFRSVIVASSKRLKGKKRRKMIPKVDKDTLMLGSLEELSKVRRTVLDPPWEGFNLIPGDVLWSDPSSILGLSPNKERGLGLLWGPDCTEDFLKHNRLKLIIRSHEGPDARYKRSDLTGMQDGYTVDHEVESGKLITLFSAPDYPQFQATDERFNNRGAYIVLHPPNFTTPIFHTFEAIKPRPQVNAYYDYEQVIDSDEELDLKSMLNTSDLED